MAIITTTWDPSNHPVHRLIQTLDTVVAASTVSRTEVHRLNYVLKDDRVEFPASDEDAYIRFRQLISEHGAVWGELFTRYDFGANEVARQLTNEVTAFFVRGGYELAKRIKGASGLSQTAVVLLTGFGQDSDRLRSSELGVTAHLVKSVDPKLLAELLASM